MGNGGREGEGRREGEGEGEWEELENGQMKGMCVSPRMHTCGVAVCIH